MRNSGFMVLLYEDDEHVERWVQKAKAGYRGWAKKVPEIKEVIARDEVSLNALLDPTPTDRERPNLIVIDLDIDGDIHAGVRAIKLFRRASAPEELPIVVFSSTGTKQARESAYRAGATSYVKKPANEERRIEALADIFGYWLELHQRR